MFKKASIFIIILIIFAKFSYTQQWNKYFGGNLDDKAYAVTIDHFGYIYVTGYSTISGHGKDIATIKINPNTGTQVWVKYYNGPAYQDDKAYSITVDRLNNIYVAGYTTGIGTGTDMTVLKYSSGGSLLWDRSYNSTTNGDDAAYAITVDDSLNVYLAGYVTLTGKDMYLAKYKSNGVYQWGRFFGGSKNEDDKAYAIGIDNLNNVFVAGYTTNNLTGADFTVIKYNRTTGGRVWVGKYDGPQHKNDIAYCMTISNLNHIYLSGSGRHDSSGDSEDFLTVRFNAENGNPEWARLYNGNGNSSDKVYAITVDELDNIYVTGSATVQHVQGSNSITTGLSFMTIKYSSGGDSLWTASYGPSGSNAISKAVCLSPSEDFLYVTGSTRKGNDPDSQDIVTLKYSAMNGEQLQASIVQGPGRGEDDAVGIAADSLNNVFLAGYVTTSTRGKDIFVSKYLRGDLIEVRNISTNVPEDFSLYQNYPNPFNPSTTIKFDVVKGGPVKLIVYDIMGRQVDVLVNENLRIGSYEVKYSSSKLSSGVYFYELTAGNYRSVKKMILLK